MAIGERYDAILDAALAEFALRGFHQASIREIARAAQLSLAGLYHYVGGKDELLFLVRRTPCPRSSSTRWCGQPR